MVIGVKPCFYHEAHADWRHQISIYKTRVENDKLSV